MTPLRTFVVREDALGRSRFSSTGLTSVRFLPPRSHRPATLKRLRFVRCDGRARQRHHAAPPDGGAASIPAPSHVHPGDAAILIESGAQHRAKGGCSRRPARRAPRHAGAALSAAGVTPSPECNSECATLDCCAIAPAFLGWSLAGVQALLWWSRRRLRLQDLQLQRLVHPVPTRWATYALGWRAEAA
jgi:hypothetical protein